MLTLSLFVSFGPICFRNSEHDSLLNVGLKFGHIKVRRSACKGLSTKVINQHILVGRGKVIVGCEEVEEVQYICTEGVNWIAWWEETVDPHVTVPPGVELPVVPSHLDCLGRFAVRILCNRPDAAISMQPISRKLASKLIIRRMLLTKSSARTRHYN
jgi:hypothetical protein